jgi:non-heme chloroperoxidase
VSLPPLIMIHGAFCGGWAFDRFRVPFETAGYAIATPTLRHHDLPPRAAPDPMLGTTSLLDYAADLDRLIAAMPEPPVLIGHSLGGLLAQMLAARRRLGGIVLIAPSAPWGVLPSGYGEVASAFGLYLAGDFWTQPLHPHFVIAREHALDKLSLTDAQAVFSRFVPESGQATFEIMHWPLDLRQASLVHAREVTCPVLCLAGGHDQVNPAGTVKRVAQRYRDRATFIEFPRMSHWLLGEPGWEDVAGTALDWLSKR